jgi:tRNA-Thr(GGU) m(6)t(6)A37 methyltransferase TsaA
MEFAMKNLFEIYLKPIGQVRNEIKEKVRPAWDKVESMIVVDPDFTASMDGLEDFSHIIVLFWMHQVIGEAPIRVHPRGRVDLPLTGVFATRAPHRPNSIGLAVVRLLERRENVLRVVGLDAIDGSPVLDIKPYLPSDSIPEAKQPDWVAKLYAENSEH